MTADTGQTAVITGRSRCRRDRARASAPVEVAILAPLAMVLILGLLGVARLTGPLLGVSAAAREAARAGTLASSAADAYDRALVRGQQVATDYGLTNGTFQLEPDTSTFGPQGEVGATATYTVHLADVPLYHFGNITVRRSHAELVGLWRSLQ